MTLGLYLWITLWIPVSWKTLLGSLVRGDAYFIMNIECCVERAFGLLAQYILSHNNDVMIRRIIIC